MDVCHACAICLHAMTSTDPTSPEERIHDVRQLSEVAAADHSPSTESPGKPDYATRLDKVEAQLDDLDHYLHDFGGRVPDTIRHEVEERIGRHREAMEESAEAAAVAAAQEAVNATQRKVSEMDQEIRTLVSQLKTLRAEVRELRQRDHQWMSKCLQLSAEQEALRGQLAMVRLLHAAIDLPARTHALGLARASPRRQRREHTRHRGTPGHVQAPIRPAAHPAPAAIYGRALRATT